MEAVYRVRSTGIAIPEEYGGNPVDDICESIIIEELARIDPSFAVMFCVHVGLCSKTIALHGNEEQKQNISLGSQQEK